MKAPPQSLAELLATVSQALPILAGRIRPDDSVRADWVAQLYADLQAAHPEAGPHYWATRSWSLLIWQPAYLSVLSVHLGQSLPQLDRLEQDLKPCYVAGFSLPVHQVETGSQSALIARAGQQLQAIQQSSLAQLRQQRPFSAKLAACLLADCLLSVLMMLPSIDARWSIEQVRALANEWLNACGLSKNGGLHTIDLSPKKPQLALDRKGCCQHFRRSDGELCSSCPKHPLPQRLQLIRQELLQE
jgi:siderophore ferric iron reductase